MARLIIVSGPGAGTEHRLEGGRISIGRDRQTKEMLISGTGQLHVEVARRRIGVHRVLVGAGVSVSKFPENLCNGTVRILGIV